MKSAQQHGRDRIGLEFTFSNLVFGALRFCEAYYLAWLVFLVTGAPCTFWQHFQPAKDNFCPKDKSNQVGKLSLFVVRIAPAISM